MELKEIGEFGFIRRVSRGCLVRPEGVERAIGDDAAAFVVPSDHLTLVTTDLLMERVYRIFLSRAAAEIERLQALARLKPAPGLSAAHAA